MVYKLMHSVPVPAANKSLMNLSQRFQKYVYCADQVEPLNIDVNDLNAIFIDNSEFYNKYDAVSLHGI